VASDHEWRAVGQRKVLGRQQRSRHQERLRPSGVLDLIRIRCRAEME
jgi:hypothetical protein